MARTPSVFRVRRVLRVQGRGWRVWGRRGKTFILTALLFAPPDFLNAAEKTAPTSIPAIPEWQKTEAKLAAKVAAYKGRNVIFINERPVAPLMYSGTEHSRETWSGQPRKSIEEFTALGYEIFQTDTWLKYSLRSDGSLDMDGIRRQLAGILEVNPDAKLVVRINVSAPRWWLDQNPQETCKVTAKIEEEKQDVFGGNKAESLASEKYAAFAERYLKQFIAELQKTPEGDRVIGFHIGGGVYGEWHYYGIYNEPDASEPMRQKFISFAKSKYGSLEQMNLAWRTAFKTIDELVVPSYARRYEMNDGDFRDPVRDRYVIDYYECQQRLVGTLVNSLAKALKETWTRPTLVGLFYGYFYGGWTVGAQASQFDIETIFRSPYVDYLSGPYASRDMNGSGIPRSLVQSVSLNGKVWITEHDGGTHLGNSSESPFPTIPKDEAQSIARMRRNFMYGLTENAGQWWYDFGPKNRSGWWSTPAMLAEAKDLLTVANTRLQQIYSKPADVLVVYDMEGFNYMRPTKADRLTHKITEAMTDSLLGTGAAFDRIFLMDLPRLDLSPYKLVIFGNTFALNSSQRLYIKDHVMQAGRTVVFMSGSGYTNGVENSLNLMSNLVGMKIEKAADSDVHPLVKIGDQTAYLDDYGLKSRFKVEDNEAQILGTYPSGSAAAAMKDVGGCRVFYFGVPMKAPLAVFKALFKESQVSTYVEDTVEKDYVSVGGGMIGIYSVSGGSKTVKPLSATPSTVLMQPYSCQYFDIHTGTALHTLPGSPPQ